MKRLVVVLGASVLCGCAIVGYAVAGTLGAALGLLFFFWCETQCE